MKPLLLLFLYFVLTGCETAKDQPRPVPMPSSNPTAATAATPAPTPQMPKNGNYPGKGKVTKINLEGGSVEIDHEEIKDVMPAMKMEFFVRDTTQLKSLALRDAVDFVLEYKDHHETIVEIKKAK